MEYNEIITIMSNIKNEKNLMEILLKEKVDKKNIGIITFILKKCGLNFSQIAALINRRSHASAIYNYKKTKEILANKKYSIKEHEYYINFINELIKKIEIKKEEEEISIIDYLSQKFKIDKKILIELIDEYNQNKNKP